MLDVVSDLERSCDPCEPLYMAAANHGIDHAMVTTREQIQESLGPVVASRKRCGAVSTEAVPSPCSMQVLEVAKHGGGRVMCTPKLVSCSLLAS